MSLFLFFECFFFPKAWQCEVRKIRDIDRWMPLDSDVGLCTCCMYSCPGTCSREPDGNCYYLEYLSWAARTGTRTVAVPAHPIRRLQQQQQQQQHTPSPPPLVQPTVPSRVSYPRTRTRSNAQAAMVRYPMVKPLPMVSSDAAARASASCVCPELEIEARQESARRVASP